MEVTEKYKLVLFYHSNIFVTFAEDFDSESFGGSSPYTRSKTLERTRMLEMVNMMLMMN